MKYLYLMTILISLLYLQSFAEEYNQTQQLQKNDEEIINNIKFEKEFLIGKRNEFIKIYGDLSVSDIIVKGTKKTRPSVIVEISGIKKRYPLSSFDPHAAINRLKKKNIFSDIGISYYEREGKAVIEITVEEKFTLIPIPYFTSNRHGWKFGFFLMETNLLGYAKSLFAGGTISSFGRTGMMGYIDPSIAGTNLTGSIFSSYKDEIYQNSNMHNSIYSEYRAVKEMFKLDMGYSFSDNFKWFASGGYEKARVIHSYKGSQNIPGDAKATFAGSTARYENLIHYEFLYYGPKIELSCYRHMHPSEAFRDYNSLKYKFEYSLRIWNYDRITVSSNGFTGSRPPVFEETIGGKQGGRTLPADTVTADDYANYTVTYEYPFLRYSWGYITLLVLWEQGVYRNSNTDMSHYYGPGTGMMFYLKRIAFPAMGFNVANNLVTKSVEFSINIGASF
jgi:outer membrane protein assembly factor BamA